MLHLCDINCQHVVIGIFTIHFNTLNSALNPTVSTLAGTFNDSQSLILYRCLVFRSLWVFIDNKVQSFLTT